MLEMGSKILARVWQHVWGDGQSDLQQLDYNQKGFRQRISTVDATQIMVGMQEDMADIKKGMSSKAIDRPNW